SSNLNNPHASAYNCGACGGQKGAPNARAFADLANRRGVRQLLRQRGIDIPDATVFVGAYHDTCSEEVHWFDTECVRDRYGAEWRRLQSEMAEACKRNAHEKCRRFADAVGLT